MKGLLTAAGLFPHPPIMVPEIGGKETKKIQQTMDAVRKSMKLIMETDPETVVVMSPHNLCLPSGPAIFIKENLAGDLMYFGHPEVSMEFSVDQELAEAVMKEAEPVIPLFRMDEAAAKKFGRKIEIDWGMFVPMYFLKKAAFKGNVLLFSPCFTNYDMNKVLGEIVTNCAEKLGRRIAIVASGDLSHRLTKDSPNGYSPDGIVFDRGVMKALEGKTMEPLLTMTDDFIERIGMCGLPSVYFLFGALSGKEWSIPVLSHEGPFGVGYGVCLCLPEEADGRKEAHDIRVRLARDSIAEYLKTENFPNRQRTFPKSSRKEPASSCPFTNSAPSVAASGRSFPSEIRRLRKSSITQKPRRVKTRGSRPSIPTSWTTSTFPSTSFPHQSPFPRKATLTRKSTASSSKEDSEEAFSSPTCRASPIPVSRSKSPAGKQASEPMSPSKCIVSPSGGTTDPPAFRRHHGSCIL